MRGFYGRQIERMAGAVGRENILVLQYEQCVRDPSGQFARTLEFLGHESYDPDPRLVRTRVNETMGTKRPVPTKDEQQLIEEYEPEVLLLKQQMPDLDLSLWPRFAHLEHA